MTDLIPLLIATQNKGKLAEYQELLDGLPVRLLGTHEAGLADFDVEENGETFADNARIKALAYAQASGMLALADDSGLAVDALNGQPGVYSARYGGPGLDDAGRRAVLLREMASVPDAGRGARFVCVIGVAQPNDARFISAAGACEGQILREERGEGGFGYDRLFLPRGYTQTYAEMPAHIKHAISHRGRAAEALKPLLAALLHTLNQ